MADFLFVLSVYVVQAHSVVFTDTKLSCSKYETALAVTVIWYDPGILFSEHYR